MIHLLSVPWLLLLAWLTSVAWFLTDDAFISFRYVRNLLEGHGLVFNPGEYVEGYTNFLWVLELAALWGLFGVRPEHAANWLSVAYTGGTLAALWWWLARAPTRHDRGFLAWLVLGLLGSSATFAVWTSGGGLETRQFTCFLVVAVVCLAVHRHQRWGLLAASLSLAAAALTRPEGLLLATCCFGWFVVQRLLTTRCSPGRDEGLAATLATVVRRLDWRRADLLGRALRHLGHGALPVALRLLWGVAAQHLLRQAYPAVVRVRLSPSVGRGARDRAVPATAADRSWRYERTVAPGTVMGRMRWCCSVSASIMYYLLRIGGAHFEYRPLDFYWPLLALPVAEGLAHLGARVAAGFRRVRWRSWRLGARAWTVALFVPVLCYASALQGALLLEGAKIDEPICREWHIELDEQNAGWLLTVPGMPALVAISNDLRQRVCIRSICRLTLR